MTWYPLNFGRYKGKTLPQLMFIDPDYFFYQYLKCRFKGIYKIQASEVYKKSCSVKIPTFNNKKSYVEYVIHPLNGKFGTLQIISENMVISKSKNYISETFDFSIPGKCSSYDKMGYRNFISAFKAIMFGASKYKMTKKRCEEFFNDDNNFVL